MKILFLDDERDPRSVGWINYPYDAEFIVVRDYDRFCDKIEELFCGNEEFGVSFDHDIQCIDLDGREFTGKDCAEFMCEMHMNSFNSCDFPKYWVHSKNPVGSVNILSYLDSYKRFISQ